MRSGEMGTVGTISQGREDVLKAESFISCREERWDETDRKEGRVRARGKQTSAEKTDR